MIRRALTRAGSAAALAERLGLAPAPPVPDGHFITDEMIDRAIEEAFESCRA